jgi:hypothetical protein
MAKALGCELEAEWCTAGSSEWKMRFEEYAIDQDSALFILTGPDDVYQTHLEAQSRYGERLSIMHNRDNHELSLEQQAEVREASGFSYELQKKYTEELAPIIADLWKASEREEGDEEVESGWKDLVFLTAFHPNDPRVRSGDEAWLSLLDTDRAELRKFSRKTFREQQDMLNRAVVVLNVTGTDTLAVIVEELLPQFDFNGKNSWVYLVDEVFNGSFRESFYELASVEDTASKLEDGVMGSTRPADILAVVIAGINSSSSARAGLSDLVDEFSEEKIRELFEKLTQTPLRKTSGPFGRVALTKFLKNFIDDFTNDFRIWCSRVWENELESRMWGYAESKLTDVLNMSISVRKASYKRGDGKIVEYDRSVYSCRLQKNSEGVKRYGTGRQFKLKDYLSEFYHLDDDEGGLPEVYYDADVRVDLDQASYYGKGLSGDDILDNLVLESEIDLGESQSFYEIRKALKESPDLPSMIEKAVSLVDYSLAVDVEDEDLEAREEAEDEEI